MLFTLIFLFCFNWCNVIGPEVISTDVEGSDTNEPLHVLRRKTGGIEIALPTSFKQISNGKPDFSKLPEVKCACPRDDSPIENALYITSTCKCGKKVIPIIKENGQCGDNFKDYSFGYEVYSSLKATEPSFLNMLRVCFSDTEGTLFTIHKGYLAGRNENELVTPVKQNDIESYKSSGIDENWKFTSAYAQENQQEHFKSILGQDVFESYKKQIKARLIPQQLVRSDDFLLYQWYPLGFYNFNVVPMWSSIANAWNELNNDLARLFRKNSEKEYFLVMSGTYGVYEFGPKSTQLYLESDDEKSKMYVPLYHWKMYRAKIFNDEKETREFQRVLVIAHNVPNFKRNKINTLCETSACNLVHWVNTVERKSNIKAYCCIATDDLLKKLQIQSIKMNLDPSAYKDKTISDSIQPTNDDTNFVSLSMPEMSELPEDSNALKPEQSPTLEASQIPNRILV